MRDWCGTVYNAPMPCVSILDLIGNTPLVELRHMSPRPGVRIFAKLEGQNPSGSIKDRIVAGIIRAAEARGSLKAGTTIIDASSGNTAIALAMVARQRGYRATVVIPRGVAPSITDILEYYGTEVVWCDSRAGMGGAVELAQQLAAEKGYYFLGQFSDPVNVETHYHGTGAEIARDLPDVDAFVAGIGTSGTIMGVGRRLRELNSKVRIIGVEPRMGERLQGLRSLAEGYIPPLLDLSRLDGRYLVDSASAIGMARSVTRAEGLLVGISGGATICAALRAAERMTAGNIVAMVADGGWKYLPARPWEAAREKMADLDEVHWW